MDATAIIECSAPPMRQRRCAADLLSIGFTSHDGDPAEPARARDDLNHGHGTPRKHFRCPQIGGAADGEPATLSLR